MDSPEWIAEWLKIGKHWDGSLRFKEVFYIFRSKIHGRQDFFAPWKVSQRLIGRMVDKGTLNAKRLS